MVASLRVPPISAIVTTQYHLLADPEPWPSEAKPLCTAQQDLLQRPKVSKVKTGERFRPLVRLSVLRLMTMIIMRSLKICLPSNPNRVVMFMTFNMF